MHELAALPAILVDRDHAGEVVAALKLVREGPGRPGLLTPAVERASALGRALTGRIRRGGRSDAARGLGLRRMPRISAPHLPAKRRKEWGRQRRRLEDGGKLAFATRQRRRPRGLPGARGRGLEGSTGHRAQPERSKRGIRPRHGRRFLGARAPSRSPRCGRAMRSSLAASCCKSGRRGFYWKTAFDEGYAALSPGVQFTLQLSSALEKAPGSRSHQFLRNRRPSDDRPPLARPA